jgi:hypothetical protein
MHGSGLITVLGAYSPGSRVKEVQRIRAGPIEPTPFEQRGSVRAPMVERIVVQITLVPREGEECPSW